MLVRLIVENFLSFKDKAEFNMIAGNFKRHKHHVQELGEGLSVLKAAAIYGANGAGKSNLIRALAILEKTVNSGDVAILSKGYFKNNETCKQQPIHVEIEFYVESRLLLYGLECRNGVVVEEWLYETLPATGEEIMLFLRRKNQDKTSCELADKYLQTEKDKVRKQLYEEELIRDNVPFLHLVNNMRNQETYFKEAKLAWEYIMSLFVITPRMTSENILNTRYHEELEQFGNKLISSFDTGVSRIDVEQISIEEYYGINEQAKIEAIKAELDTDVDFLSDPDDKGVVIIKVDDKYIVRKLVTFHKGESGEVKYPLTSESDGTLRLLDFVPLFYMLMNFEVTIVIDEIDRSIHPALLKEVLKSLATNASSFKGQLVFTTHESNLLDFEIFRQDEIWFASKNATGNTELYPLSDFDVRADLDWKKGYLAGRFGAIPFLNNLEHLNWKSEHHGKDTQPGV